MRNQKNCLARTSSHFGRFEQRFLKHFDVVMVWKKIDEKSTHNGIFSDARIYRNFIKNCLICCFRNKLAKNCFSLSHINTLTQRGAPNECRNRPLSRGKAVFSFKKLRLSRKLFENSLFWNNLENFTLWVGNFLIYSLSFAFLGIKPFFFSL